MKSGVEPVPEASWLHFSILNSGFSPEKQNCMQHTIVQNFRSTLMVFLLPSSTCFAFHFSWQLFSFRQMATLLTLLVYLTVFNHMQRVYNILGYARYTFSLFLLFSSHSVTFLFILGLFNSINCVCLYLVLNK
jgi:hypothetical protein